MKDKHTDTKARVGINAFTAQATIQRNTDREFNGLVVTDPPEPVITENGQTTYPDTYPRELLSPMADAEIAHISRGVISAMTFSEKDELLHSLPIAPKETGCSSFVGGIPRLGVPAMIQNDGPSGVNAVYETTNLPVELVLGCTFSPLLARKYGTVLGRELKSVGANWQLGAQFDLTRSPYWMRTRDTMGEDYYLTGELAVELTKGIQENGVGAMAKHLGAYSSGGDGALSITVDEQTLHTAYLYPFEQAVIHGRLASIMTSYNRVNGYNAASSPYLNIEVPRDMWNWPGNITTDAGGNKEVSVHLGTDNEMGIAPFNAEPGLRAYLRKGLLTMEDIDRAIGHLLWGYGAAGYLGLVAIDPDTHQAKEDPHRTEPIMPVDSYYKDRISGLYKEDNTIAEEICLKGSVLLKNEGSLLPLAASDFEKGVALIGLGAKYPVCGTGFERSQGVWEYVLTPQESILEHIPDAKLTVEPYKDVLGHTIPEEYFFSDEQCLISGLERSWGILHEDSYVIDYSVPGAPRPPLPGMKDPYAEARQVDVPGRVTGTVFSVDSKVEFLCKSHGFCNGIDGNAISSGCTFTWKGYLKAAETGDTDIIFRNMGGNTTLELFDGDVKLISVCGGNDFGHGVQWEFDMPDKDGLSPVIRTVSFSKGKAYRLLITADAVYPEKDVQLWLAWNTPSMKLKDKERAIAAAQNNPVVIYFARTGILGHHGIDLEKKNLTVNNLEDLLTVQKAAIEAGNRFIVVMNSRSAFALEGGWHEKTDALISLFYGGQAQNSALVKLLTGKENFSGKLCVTLPETSKDVCTHSDMATMLERWGDPQDMGTEFSISYTEGLDFGYRWNKRTGTTPAYPFGFGLSYTTFAYDEITVIASGTGFEVSLSVTNTGNMKGDEIVQVYLGKIDVPNHIQCAEEQLVGFARTGELKPGESKNVRIRIGERMLSYWDPHIDLITREDGTRDKWVRAVGTREIIVAKSSEEAVFSKMITIHPEG